ncbi:MAG TPA: hypothetical protein PKH02_07360 [Bacteroidales bacterium]|nr:hypothetical protein [Bacteroidales bacterium]HPT12065.1 hypothetical protein [Bacteroidales bacterium]
MLSKYISITALLLLIAISSTTAQESSFHPSPSINLYFNLNQSYPVGSVRNDAKMVYQNDLITHYYEFPSGINTGVSLFFFRKLSFDLAFSIYHFDSDTARALSYNKIAFPDNQVNTFITGGLGLITASTGISYRLEWKNLAFQPKLLIGYGAVNVFGYYDVYLSENNNHTRTIEYSNRKVANTIAYTPSLNVNYVFRLDRHVALGFQVTCDYVYLRPEIEYNTRTYNYISKTITEGEKSVRENISFWSIQAGVFLRILHTH